MATKQTPPERKKPERRCVGCSEHKLKTELIRVVRSPEGEVSLDFTGKKSGRGVYVCRSTACFSKAKKAHRFETGLGVEIPAAVYERIEKELSENE